MLYVAWKMLFGDRIKSMTLIVGLTFATLLITQQGSIFCGIMMRANTIIRNTNVPIWVADPGIKYVEDVKPMADTDLAKVRSVPGVEWAVPFFKRITQAQLRSGKSENIELIGVDAQSLIGCPRDVVAGRLADLATPDAVAIDKRNLRKLGYPQVGDTFEINDHQARIVAIVDIPPSFQFQPAVYTTYDKALTFYPPQRKMLSYVLVKPAAGIPAEALARRIAAQTGLGAFTADALGWKTIRYYIQNTGIPVNFGTTVILGILVGGAISAQTFYTFTLDNLRHFATMKAMGADNRMLTLMILLQSLAVGFIGYGLGLLLMTLFATSAGKHTNLAFYTPLPLLGIAFVMVVGVCVISSVFSIWKAVRIEPALVFRT